MASVPAPAPAMAQDTEKLEMSVGDTVRFPEGLKNSPVKMRDRDLYVRMISKNNVSYSPNKTGKREWRTTSADRLLLVKKTPVKAQTKAQKEASFIPSPEHKLMTKQYDLKDNDIFLTPDFVYEYMSAMLGYDVQECFDPCPAEFLHGLDWDGLKGQWESPAFCNPPFSKTYEWIEKVVTVVEAGGRVVLLISSADWFTVEGKERCALWEDFRRRVQFRALSSNEYISGACHKWFRWGANMLNGKLSGGSMFGISLFEVVAGEGEVLVPVTPPAAKIIGDYRNRNVKTPPPSPPLHTPAADDLSREDKLQVENDELKRQLAEMKLQVENDELKRQLAEMKVQ